MAATLSLVDAADELGLTPARLRRLVDAGALPAVSGPDEPLLVPRAAVGELRRRGTVRAVDVAAVESAMDRVLRRRLDPALDSLTAPLVAANDDARHALAEQAALRAAAEARAARAETALAAARDQVETLTARVKVLEAQPVGLFRRRRRLSAPATP